LDSFNLHGKIIDKDNKPKKNLTVTAYDSDRGFSSDELLGTSKTDKDGFFSIKFTDSNFQRLGELFEGRPDVYLVIKNSSGKELLKTNIKKTKKEILYRIKLSKSDPNPNVPDIYADNTRRLFSMLDDVGININQENTINLGMLQNLDLPEEIRKRIQESVNSYDRNIENINHLIAILNGVIYANLTYGGVDVIGYDGPQVQRNAWKDGDIQAIMWPREESWG
jgi:hypothetical protein